MDPREVQTESLDAESRNVAELLGGLKRVEAPSNFEFGVRARIAAGAPQESWSLFPIVGVVAPLALVLVVGMAVLLYGGFLTSDLPVAGVEPPEQEVARRSTVVAEFAPAAPAERPSGPQIEEEPVDPKASEPQTSDRELAVRPPLNRQRRSTRSVPVPPGGGSVDRTVRDAPVISAPGTHGTIVLNEAFDIIGMSGDLSADGWTVRSIKDGTSAHRSGIKSGDIVESIDGLSISGKAAFASPFTPKTIRVRRDGKVIDLKLAN